jgi:CBS domain-containing protein
MQLTESGADVGEKSHKVTGAKLKVRDIMTRDVISICEDDTIGALCALLSQFRLSALPVVDKRGVLVGIVSEKDIIAHEVASTEPGFANSDLFELISAKYLDPEEIHPGASVAFVEEVMTRNVVTVSPDQSVVDAARIFCQSHFHRIPVVEEGKLVGIVSTVDVLKALTTD